MKLPRFFRPIRFKPEIFVAEISVPRFFVFDHFSLNFISFEFSDLQRVFAKTSKSRRNFFFGFTQIFEFVSAFHISFIAMNVGPPTKNKVRAGV